MRQRGSIIVYLVLALAILGAVAGLIWWADANIATSAGVKKGEANVTAKWEKANREQRAKEAQQAAGAAQKLEVSRAKSRVVYRTITQDVDRVITRDVYRNVCLDADGLRIANAALNGGADPAAPKPDRPVPGSDVPAGRVWGERSAEIGGDRGVVLRLSTETLRIGGGG